LQLIGIDFYSGAIKFTKYLPTLPGKKPFFFAGYITYYSSDRNRYIWLNPADYVEDYQIYIDSYPTFEKVLAAHILIQDKNGLKYFDNNKIYWQYEFDGKVIDAVEMGDFAFLLTEGNELVLVNLMSGNILWRILLKFKVKKLFKYAGYLFLQGDNTYYLVELSKLKKVFKTPTAFYEISVRKTLKNVKTFLFGNKNSLYFRDNNMNVVRYNTKTLEPQEVFRGLSQFKFVWEHASNEVLVFKKPSFLYYYSMK
jgi:hypothetical protein